MDVRLINGFEAKQLLADPGFISAWDALHRACPWASVFQHPEFAKCWFASYGEQWAPLLVLGKDASGNPAGLLVLAVDREHIVHAGAHQAEYQTWLARDEAGSRQFLEAALPALRTIYPRGSLALRYLPVGTPLGALRDGAMARHCQWRAHRQPLIELADPETIAASLRKKSNKSRRKRLEQALAAELVAETIDDLEPWIDRIAADYDQRQHIANGVRPFATDPAKRQFHIDLARAGLLHCFLYRAGDRLAAAVLSMRDGERLAVAVFAHAPALDEHSPGKFALYRLAIEAAGLGCSAIDLTPGGEWKDRFANQWLDPAEVTIRFSAQAARKALWRSRAGQAGKRLLASVGLSPGRVRRLIGRG